MKRVITGSGSRITVKRRTRTSSASRFKPMKGYVVTMYGVMVPTLWFPTREEAQRHADWYNATSPSAERTVVSVTTTPNT